MSLLANFSQQLAGALDRIGDASFEDALVAALKSLAAADDATIILYPEEGLPVVKYFEVQTDRESSLSEFVRGPFLLDPYYLAAVRERQFGVFLLRELAPAGFRESAYYRNYYRNCGLQDECGYVIPLDENGFVNIALGKMRHRARFTQKELQNLRDIYPLLVSLCRQQWRPDARAPTGGPKLREQMGKALAAFGTSVLTERETQVIQLVLHGHSTRTIAEKLNISTETVKLHRKHAYAKLEVSSQAELFYLFLDSLMSATNYAGGDALIEYLSPPAKGVV